MFASELVEKLNQLIKEHGDVRITTFDLDRDICEVTEIEFSTFPYKNIYIG